MKKKDFTFLNPDAGQARHKRVQFTLNDNEYAILEDAAMTQASKPGDLAGDLFRKYILPGLAEELGKLREKSPKRSSVTLSDAIKGINPWPTPTPSNPDRGDDPLAFLDKPPNHE